MTPSAAPDVLQPDDESAGGPIPDDRFLTRVLAVASGKGGVGKTSVAVNTAFALASLGRRVCLLDADLGLSNVDVLLGITPAVTLEDVLFEGMPMERAVMSVSRGVDVISGSSGVSRMAELSREKRQDMTREFHKLTAYDYVIVDNSPGITAQVVSLCLSCGDVLVIVNPEPSSITDAYALIKVFKENGLSKNPLVAINRAHSRQRAQRVFEHIHKTALDHLGVECFLAGIIPDDPALYRAASRQRSLMETEPHAAAAKAFLDLARNLDALSGDRGSSFQKPEQFFDQSVMRLQQAPVLPPSLAGPGTGMPVGRDFRERVEFVLRQLMAAVKALESHEPELARDARDQIEALRQLLEGPDSTAEGQGLDLDGAIPELAPPPEKASDHPGAVPTKTGTTDATALLVCDNPLWRDMLAGILADLGIAAVAPEEVDDPARPTPALIVVQAESARPLAAALLERRPATPALCLFTDRGQAHHFDQTLPPGTRRVVMAPPVSLADLQNAICHLL